MRVFYFFWFVWCFIVILSNFFNFVLFILFVSIKEVVVFCSDKVCLLIMVCKLMLFIILWVFLRVVCNVLKLLVV